MSKINELPELERPREKFLHYGISSLSDEELLAVLIGSGYKGKNAKDVGYEILSSCGGLQGFSKLTYKSLLSFKGINKVKAISLSAVIELYKRIHFKNNENGIRVVDEEYLNKKYMTYFTNMLHEELIVICLNINRHIVHEEVLFKGPSNSVNSSIKEIIRVLLDYDSKYFYLIHNHPSGLSSPSTDDILMTQILILKSKQIGITLIDHLIFGKTDYYSFKNKIVLK